MFPDVYQATDAARVLVIVDDPADLHVVESLLLPEGHRVATAASIGAAVTELARERPDLVVLDLTFDAAQVTGWLEVLGVVHDSGDRIPLIVLTGHDSAADRVTALRTGADDWVRKPYLVEEVQARVHAVLRRARPSAHRVGPRLQVGDLELHEQTCEVTRGGRRLQLTVKEFELLRLLLRNAHVVLSREAILDEIWRHSVAGPTKSVDVYVGYLRRKLGDPPLLHTVRGIGYVLRPPHPDEG